jgi:cysteinyl-tRNA synthetase
MTLRLYNTLTRTKEDFTPIDPNNVRMYVCGPTVYDFAHIGNARPVIVFDVLFRLLRHLYGESHVTYVRNITDVDDKINARALRDFPNLPLNEAIRAVTQTTADRFRSDAKDLGCLSPTQEPRATDNIDEMKAMIQTLLDRGHAYISSGADGREALFSVSSMPEYGKLSGRKLDEQLAGARVAVDVHKKNPADFVLWKESGEKEPGWEGSFTPKPEEGYEANFKITENNREALRLNSNLVTIHGRPGWHIECSAMSKRYLGEVFDIHGGGLDLIFPHHENEIAQSRCAHGSDVMANVWMHNGFLQVEGQKMSKSLGNFYTIADLMESKKFGGRKWSGEVLRLAMLMTNYRQPIDWTIRSLEEAEKILARWKNFVLRSEIDLESNDKPPDLIVEKLLDDLNIHGAITAMHAFTKVGASNLGLFDEESSAANLEVTRQAAHSLLTSMRLLGLDSIFFASEEADPVVVRLIEDRLVARHTKNWKESDRIRDELDTMGIAIKDNKDGTTTWDVKR